MTTPINSNISSIQFFRATSAFKNTSALKQQQATVEETQVQEFEPETPQMSKMFAKHNIDEIKSYAKSIGEENLSNEDIKYGMYYGRSVIVDYSV